METKKNPFMVAYEIDLKKKKKRINFEKWTVKI